MRDMEIKTTENVYNNKYFRINKTLQEITGLWPYAPRFQKVFSRVIVISVLVLMAMPHMNAVRIWCGVNMGLCAENMSGTVYSAGVLLKYIVTLLSEDNMSKVYQKVASTWLSIQDTDERIIMTEYARLGKFKSISYVGYLGVAGIAFSQFGMIPIIMDFIMPLNESRPKIQVVKAEFGVDPSDYFYEIYLLYCIIAIVSTVVLMSIDTMYTTVVHQNLAVLNVVKYRLQLATKYPEKGEDFSYKTIYSAIYLHKDAIQLSKDYIDFRVQVLIRFNDLLETTYETCFLVLICICVLFLSFGAITIMENANVILDIIRMTMVEVGTAIHLFYLSWPGQLVIDESFKLFHYTYMNEWYNVSERAKTLIKIMMARCMKPCCLTAAGMYIMNFENYGAIIKTTVSYIAVLTSFR